VTDFTLKMMMRLSVILIVSSVLVGNLYAESARWINNMDRKVMLDINSNSKKIELKAGDEIQIELEGSSGTGYCWYFDRLDNALFELIGEDTNINGREEKEMAGRPIIGIWKLRARKPGHGIVRMKYYRAWEKSEKAINQFEINVDISP